MRLFAGVVTLPLLAVLVRLGDLRSDAGGLLDGTSEPTRAVLETIPARDGRILSSDGQILAEDVETFSVLVHYRWLERPADPTWLRSEALRALSPIERRDQNAVAAAERDVLAKREALWESLVRLTGTNREELFSRFARVQEKVSAVRRAVEEARRRPAPQPSNREGATSETWWRLVLDEVAEAVTSPPGEDRTEPIVLAEELDHHEIAAGLPIAVAAAIESAPDHFPGTRVRVSSRRRYPLGATAAHLIGYRFPGSASTEDGDPDAGSVGQTGVERAYDRHLRGVDGVRRVWLNRRGEPARTETIREPRVGRDLVLHVDIGLQTEVERFLDAAVAAAKSPDAEPPIPESAGGAVVVMDVRSGAVVAAASAPRFDLSRAAARDRRLWEEVLTDPQRPLFDRVCAAALPPGSVFKIVSAVALLESGRIDPDLPFECVGYLD
ncbi:MAG TPA: penicillin-binding transpeptidase domain-containing protein, partial [Planctomycetaceae bacterium]